MSRLTPARQRSVPGRKWAALVLAYSAVAALLGCRERVSGSDGAPSLAACAEVGQRCEVSPGKLGSCVLLDGCGKSNCYVCQSQH